MTPGLLKYPGGKSYLADKIVYYLPRGTYARYVEPFLGGGAVMLAYGARPGNQAQTATKSRREEVLWIKEATV